MRRSTNRYPGPGLTSGQQHTHRLQGAAEGVEYDTEYVQGNDAQQGLIIAGLTKDGGCTGLAVRQGEMAFRDATADGGPVGKDELVLAFGR